MHNVQKVRWNSTVDNLKTFRFFFSKNGEENILEALCFMDKLLICMHTVIGCYNNDIRKSSIPETNKMRTLSDPHLVLHMLTSLM